MSTEEYRKEILSNGLPVIAVLNKEYQSAALGFFVRTGSRDETSTESGISHFLEHMMFKGSENRDAIELGHALGTIGAQSNAYTSEEHTVYYGAVVTEYLPRLQEIVSEMLQPTLDPKEFETEKQVILEEIALYNDRPHVFLFESALADYFGAHPAGNSVLGTAESVAALSPEQMRSYFERRYAPSNMALVCSGNFDIDQYFQDAETRCGKWRKFDAPRDLQPYPSQETTKVYEKENIHQAHVVLVSQSCGAESEDRFAMAVISTLLGDDAGSKLYWELLESGLAESAGTENDERSGVGVFLAYASASADRIAEVSDILRRICSDAGNFSDDDLDRAKTKLITKVALGTEVPMGRLMAAGTGWLFRDRVDTIQVVLDGIAQVDRQKIESVLAKYPLRKWGEYRLVPKP